MALSLQLPPCSQHEGLGVGGAAVGGTRPVVATACAGTRDIVVDGDNGLIVPPDDLGERARASVERYRWEAVRDRLEAVLAGWSAT